MEWNRMIGDKNKNKWNRFESKREYEIEREREMTNWRMGRRAETEIKVEIIKIAKTKQQK